MRNFIEQFIRLIKFYKKLYQGKISTKESAEIVFEMLYETKFYTSDIKKLGLSENISKVYSVASEIIHKVPPLPFYSILELKLFEKVLKSLVKEIEKSIEKLWGLKPISVQTGKVDPWDELKIEQEALKKAIYIERTHGDKIEKILREELNKLDPLHKEALVLVFMILSRLNIRKGLIVENEFWDSIKNLGRHFPGIIYNEMLLAEEITETLKEKLSKRLMEEKIIEDTNWELTKKTSFYLIALTSALKYNIENI